MTTLTVCDLPNAVHRSLQMRAALNGRSMEEEVRAILEDAVKPEGHIKLGTLLVQIGQETRLSEEEFGRFGEARGMSHPDLLNL